MREIKFRAWDKEKKIMIDDQDQKVQKQQKIDFEKTTGYTLIEALKEKAE